MGNVLARIGEILEFFITLALILLVTVVYKIILASLWGSLGANVLHRLAFYEVSGTRTLRGSPSCPELTN